MADYVVDNISIEIEASAKTGIESIDNLIRKTTDLNSQLEVTVSNVKKMANEFTASTSKASHSVDRMDTSLKNTDKSVKSTGISMGKAFKVGAVVAFGRAMMKSFSQASEYSMDYIQNNNMLNATMGESIDKAREFNSVISNSLNLDSSAVMKYQSNYQMLASSFGVANDNAYLLSENLTKLTYDMSSLHGVDFEQMYSRLSSGLAGQSKQLLTMGIDVTAGGLQAKLDALGIDALVANLSQAEKVLLRYITILDQSNVAHGYMAKSLESPRNQIMILKEQIKQLYTWIGNTFITLLGNVLPYINAFVMAIKEVVKSLALMFGFKLDTFSFKNTGGIGGLGDDFGKLESNAGKAQKAIKKVKDQVFGKWNELNIIKTPEEPVQPNGGKDKPLGPGSYYKDLVGELKGYDNLMGSVSEKSKKIRNNILDWLGFTYDINRLTGEIENVKWGGWKEMSNQAKILSTILGGIAAFKIGKIFFGWGKSFVKAFNLIKNLKIVAWVGNVFKAIKNFGFSKTLLASLTTITTKVSGFFAAIGGGSVMAGLGIVGAAIAVVVGLVASFKWGLSDSIKEVDIFNDVSEETVKRMKPFQDSFESLDKKLKTMAWGNSVINQKDVDEVIANLNEMTGHIKNNLMKDLEDTKAKIIEGDLFEGMDPLAKQGIVDKMEEGMKENIAIVDGYSADMTSILQKAANENRALTEEEKTAINDIQKKMYETGVKTLTASQEDQDTILRNMKDNATELSALQASEIVKDAVETKKAVIKEAEDKYAEEMRIADQLWKRGDITKEQYDEMTSIAKLGYDNTLAEAERSHDDIIENAKKHSGKYINHIDWSNGQVKNKFQVMWGDIVAWGDKAWEDFSNAFNKMAEGIANWWNDDIAPWFTKEKWSKLIGDAWDGLKSGWNNTLKWFKDNVKFPEIKLPEIKWPKIKMPKFSVKGSMNPLDWISKGLPELDVKFYAGGGFPEVGEFYVARENGPELLGSIGGRNAVMNNDQIVASVSSGVAHAVSSVLGNNSNNTSNQPINVYLYPNSDAYVKATVKDIENFVQRTGYEPSF